MQLLLLCYAFVGLREPIALKLRDILSPAILSGCLKLQACRPTGFDFQDQEGSCRHTSVLAVGGEKIRVSNGSVVLWCSVSSRSVSREEQETRSHVF